MQKTKPSPKRRWLTACLWSIAGILLLGVLAATVLNIVDWRMRETSTQDSTYPLGGTTVSLTHFAVGNIRIVAGATDTVTVHSTVKQDIRRVCSQYKGTATLLLWLCSNFFSPIVTVTTQHSTTVGTYSYLFCFT